jgi:pimeloyl-ACP methyl ester carboxylesterase
MAAALDEAGYEVVQVGYPSSRANLRAHADQVETVLNRLEGVERVSFVTHSLGGPVARTVLAREDAPWRTRITPSRLVMLFPPSQGSFQAERFKANPLFRIFGGPVGEELRPSRAQRIPQPTIPFAIVAGGKGDGVGRNRRIPGDDDGTVAVSEARLPGADAFAVLDVGHTFGMNDPTLIERTVTYLQTGAWPK